MQPYLFPYIGYYQLVDAADIFVLLDDASFIKRGFMNRNWVVDRSGAPVPFRIPVKAASQNRRINELVYGAPGPKPLRTLQHCYAGELSYQEPYSLVEKTISKAEGQSVAKINSLSITLVANHLGFSTSFIFASEVDPDPTNRGQERILDLCRRVGASRYINPSGGRSLYDAHLFARDNIQLSFLNTEVKPLTNKEGKQWHPSFLHCLFTQPITKVRDCLDEIRIRRV